ncbi:MULTISPECIES: hypothetical protein [Paenibacillus]|uniref:Uncharacterized protein n=2 Tax=Paenibacillus TaxID=44249 RepID=A0AAP4EDF6_PAEPO|nr:MULTISPECIES: hypothetical protein [Paenibacillus]MCP3743949.1 hypothetical protein [Paenibacillus sp. A3M_27_13]MDH2333919.1 hypothetical protein [Paenibacillus polymyxa]
MICNAAMLITDIPKWKRTNRRARILYLSLMLPIAYLGLLYITNLPWPNLDELIDFFLLAPAKRIVAWFRLPT